LESFISIDIEAGGPTPEYNLCSIGACEVANTSNGFYIELKPITSLYIPEAISVGGFTHRGLTKNGTPALNAMQCFDSWLSQFDRPKMIAFNGAFDWQFINYYFWKFLKRNPLGINCLDIKALYMGYSGCEWKQTNKKSIPERYKGKGRHTHNALDDAVEQAELFSNIYAEARR
jgi:ribonuclease T